MTALHAATGWTVAADQVASLMEVPDLLHPDRRADVLRLFPKDAVDRALLLSKAIGSVGAYSHSMGIPYVLPA